MAIQNLTKNTLTMKVAKLSLCAAVLLAMSVSATAATVTSQKLSFPTWDFSTIADPSASDFADQNSGNGVVASVHSDSIAFLHAFSGAASALIDGIVQANDDHLGPSVFFADNVSAGLLVLDLQSDQQVDTINLYSWHRSSRGPQKFTVYGASGAAAPSVPGGTDFSAWTSITSVNTSGIFPGGQYGTSITGVNATYRYLLFEVNPPNNISHTFFGEIDVTTTAVPEPSTLALAALGLLGLMGIRRRRNR